MNIATDQSSCQSIPVGWRQADETIVISSSVLPDLRKSGRLRPDTAFVEAVPQNPQSNYMINKSRLVMRCM